MNLNKGEIIATLVAYGFKGHVGPMGGEDPIVEENKVILYSQLPECGYQFNDDGSVDCFYPDKDAMYNSLIYDCGYEEDEATEEVNNPNHYNNIMNLFESDDGWFMYFLYDNPSLVIAIQEVLKHKEEE